MAITPNTQQNMVPFSQQPSMFGESAGRSRMPGSSFGGDTPTDPFGWIGSATKNALWQAGPGLVGVQEPMDLARWQAENPISSFGTSLAGLAVPYLGWAKATQAGTKLGRTMQGAMDKVAPAANMASMPIRTAAAREMVRFAPLEAGRIATAPVLGPMFEESFGGEYRGAWEVAQSAATDLVLGGAVGGLFGGLSAYGRKARKRRGNKPGADLNAPLQVQLRQTNEALKKGLVDEDAVDLYHAGRNRLKREIVEETPEEGQYFNREENQKKFQDLFQPRDKTRFRVGKVNSDKFYQSSRMQQLLDDLPEDWQAFTKFPRIIQTRRMGDAKKNAKNDAAVKDQLQKLRNGDANTRWDWLDDEQTFVVAKKLSPTEHMVFKTDRPDMFLPEQAAWKRIMERGSKVTFGRTPYDVPENTGSELYDFGAKLQKDLPFVDWRGLKSKEGAFSQTIRELGQKSGFRPYEGTGEAARRAGLFIRRYMAPAQLQTTDNPVANKIRIVTKEVLERGEQLAQRSILGTPKRTKGSQTKTAFFGPKWDNNGSIAARARQIADDPEEWDAVIKTIQDGGGYRAGIRKYGLSERGVQLLKRVEAEDARLSQSIIQAQKAARIPEKDMFVPRENHFMLSRTWKGSWRVPVYNSRGNMVYIAGGNTRSEAQSIADAMVNSHGGWRRAEPITSSEMQDMELLKKVMDRDLDFNEAMRQQREIFKAKAKAPKPGTFKQREDVEGYQTDYDVDDFIRSMIQHTRRYRRYEAEVSTRGMFKKEYDNLQFDDPEAYVTLVDRLDKMYGKEGEITKAINNAFDTVLSGALGNNSASKIVGGANKLLYRYALGFANIGYAVATMGTFIQTAFPQMQLINSLAMNAPERLAKYTTYQPVFSEKGARMMGAIDAMKIAGQGWKELGQPDANLWKNLNRAAEEGVTDPRFIDEWVGQTAVNKQRFKGILEGKESFSKILEAIADTLPAVTERGARGHSFAMGHVFYRDIMGVTDPELLYRLSKDFTEKTQFMYSAGDRAQIFNGPLGGMFGLFKNWMSHYTGWMFSYMGEAAKYGNWKPLLWMMAGTTGLGGVGALPFVGVADDFAKAFNNEGLLLNLYEMQGGADPDGVNMADAAYYGLPSLFGASIQGTVSAPLAEPGADIIRMFEFAHMSQGRKIMNAIGPVVDAMEAEGQYFLSDQEARRALLNATAPKTLIRMSQAWESPDIRSLNTGNVMVKDMSPIQRVLWGLSLNPKEVEAQFEISRELWGDQKKLRERVGYYGQQLANLYNAKEMGEVQRLMMRATVEGIPLDSIQRSAQARMSRQNQGLLEAQFDKAVQARMRELNLL